jgi:hypothetical protein
MIQDQRVDLVVTVTDGTGVGSPPAQALAALMRPRDGAARASSAGSVYDNVDRVPTAAPGFRRPQTYLISIGISSHRDPQSSLRKYAALDAELVATYFREAGGVPVSNVRLLQDWKALRAEIEEAILDWLPLHVTSDSVVIFYFAGHAKVSPTGETFLVPYEGGHSLMRLLSLKELRTGLNRLKARQILFIFDGSVSRLNETNPQPVKDPQWDLGNNTAGFISTTGIRDSLEPDTLHHGLFTYYLLRGLKGEADDNHDQEVTLGELSAYVGRAIPAAAKKVHGQEQRPLLIAPMIPGSKPARVTLTRSAPPVPSESQ